MRTVRSVRDLTYPCGSSRSVVVCRTTMTTTNDAKKKEEEQEKRKRGERSGEGKDKKKKEEKKGSEEGGEGGGGGGGSALVRMGYPNGALNLVSGWEAARKQILTEAASESGDNDGDELMRAYLAPPPEIGGPDINFDVVKEEMLSPPPSSDERLVTKIVEVYRSLRKRHELSSRPGATTAGGAAKPKEASSADDKGKKDGAETKSKDGSKADDKKSTEGIEDKSAAASTEAPKMKLDTAKVAAAAGGGAYDEEADPLNAPEVLAAVVSFKKRLEERDGNLRKRRAEVVDRRLKERRVEARRRLLKRREEEKERERKKKEEEEEKKKKELFVVDREGMAPPPPPPPPPPAGAEKGNAVPEGVADTGRRGVSNLPAWMTKKDGDASAKPTVNVAPAASEGETASKKRKFVPSEANRDLNARKQRIDTEGLSLAEIRARNEAEDMAAAAKAKAKEKETRPTDDAADRFPPLPTDRVPDLRSYVTSKIVEHLGEEETTLIDFVLNQIARDGGCTRRGLLEEMKPVLDEDAEAFVDGVWEKVAEFVASAAAASAAPPS